MIRILIAEDELDIRELIKMILSYGGYEVVAARDGREAVELASKTIFDLILMDVRMPYLTGFEACRLIKELPHLAHVPVVFLSAKGQRGEISEGLAAGARAYLLKPFAPEDLLDKIDSLLKENKAGQRPQNRRCVSQRSTIDLSIMKCSAVVSRSY